MWIKIIASALGRPKACFSKKVAPLHQMLYNHLLITPRNFLFSENHPTIPYHKTTMRYNNTLQQYATSVHHYWLTSYTSTFDNASRRFYSR